MQVAWASSREGSNGRPGEWGDSGEAVMETGRAELTWAELVHRDGIGPTPPERDRHRGRQRQQIEIERDRETESAKERY